MSNTPGIRRPSPHVAGIAARLLANGPAAVKACKALVPDVAGRASDEGREGAASCLGKREPARR